MTLFEFAYYDVLLFIGRGKKILEYYCGESNMRQNYSKRELTVPHFCANIMTNT